MPAMFSFSLGGGVARSAQHVAGHDGEGRRGGARGEHLAATESVGGFHRRISWRDGSKARSFLSPTLRGEV